MIAGRPPKQLSASKLQPASQSLTLAPLEFSILYDSVKTFAQLLHSFSSVSHGGQAVSWHAHVKLHSKNFTYGAVVKEFLCWKLPTQHAEKGCDYQIGVSEGRFFHQEEEIAKVWRPNQPKKFGAHFPNSVGHS